ncbi:hypothetical protein Tco_0543452 [Tanacetum coccineum]
MTRNYVSFDVGEVLAEGLGFKPHREGFPSGAKKEWGLSPNAKVRVLHTAQLDVTVSSNHYQLTCHSKKIEVDEGVGIRATTGSSRDTTFGDGWKLVFEGMSRSVPKGMIPEGVSRSVPEGVSRSVPEGMSRSVPEGMSRSVPEGMSRSVPEGMSRSVPGGMSRSVPGGMSRSVPEGMSRSVSEGMSRSVPS